MNDLQERLTATFAPAPERSGDAMIDELVQRTEERDGQQRRFVRAAAAAIALAIAAILLLQRGTAPPTIASAGDVPLQSQLPAETPSFVSVIPTLFGDVWLRVGLALGLVVGGSKLLSTWRRSRLARPMGPARAGLMIALVVLLAVVVGVVTSLDLRFVASQSMAPALTAGNQVLVATHDTTPELGDIMAFNDPNGDWDILKRVVAVGGDTIEARDGVLIRNGNVANTITVDSRRPMRDFGPVAIGSNEVFLIGDNYAASVDSRQFGPLSTDDIRGTVRWSR